MKLKLAALALAFAAASSFAQDKPKEQEPPKAQEQYMCYTESFVQAAASMIAQQQKIILDLREQLAQRQQSGMFAK